MSEIDWAATPTPAVLPKDERGRLEYRAAAEVAAALDGIPGWRTQRTGVGVGVWIGPDRYVHRRPDYMIWTEDLVDQHLHKSIEAAAERRKRDAAEDS